MNLYPDILKNCLTFPQNQAFFINQLRGASDYVKFGQAPLILYAGRSPPLQHKENGRSFCFLTPIQ